MPRATTMPWAVRVYERICERRMEGMPEGHQIPIDEYVFMPKAANLRLVGIKRHLFLFVSW